ncbi:MAG: dTMP kinase [Granulosicoccaceae bacterium]
MSRGQFISLEGLEGVGKTTNRLFIEKLLKQAGIEVVVSREPGGTELGESLRELLLHGRAGMLAQTELLLMTASRSEHIDKVIEPALSQGHWVLSDRFTDASFAYQGGGRELGASVVTDLHLLMKADLQPNLTLLLDMPIEAGMARAASRGKLDRIESEERAFFERARAAYLQRAAGDPQRIKIIDAGQSLEQVQQAVSEALQPLLAAA